LCPPIHYLVLRYLRSTPTRDVTAQGTKIATVALAYVQKWAPWGKDSNQIPTSNFFNNSSNRNLWSEFLSN